MENLAEQIVTILEDRYLMGERITPDTAFADLDLDSLVMVELSVLLERRYGVRITDGEIFDAGSVRQVAALVEAGSRHLVGSAV